MEQIFYELHCESPAVASVVFPEGEVYLCIFHVQGYDRAAHYLGPTQRQQYPCARGDVVRIHYGVDASLD